MLNYGNVALHIAESNHVPFVVKCVNDKIFETRSFKKKTSVGEQNKEIKSLALDKNNKLYIVVCDGQKKGVCYITDISWKHRSCRMNLYLEDREKNIPLYGEKIMKAVINYLFNQLGLNKLSCETIIDDEVMTGLYKSIGMVKEVNRRSQKFSQGTYKTIIEYGLLSREFKLA